MAESAPQAIARRWREGPSEDQTARKVRARQRKLFTLQLLILALTGAIVMMLLWIRAIPHPHFLALWVARSRAPQFPTLPMADPDLKLVAAHTPEKVLDAQDRLALSDGLLDRFKALGMVDAVVMYVHANACIGVRDAAALKAGGDDPGRVLILPADADPNSRQNWVELRGVLENLRDHCRARHKLLVLDVMPALTDPRLGILAPDAASRIQADLEAVPDPRRLALCACSPGEVSLVSEELGRSVFNHYLEEGLRGWADAPSGSLRRDGIVSARELARYVARHVSRWARRNRDARQTPFLHGSARDIPLVALQHNRPLPHVTAPEPKTYPDWLLGGWHLRDQWWADQSYRTAPWGFRRLEANLLAAEHDWRGGTDPAVIDEERIAPLLAIEEQLRQARLIPQPKPPRSLAVAAALGRKPIAAPSEALTSLMTARAELAKKGTAEELAKALEKPVADFHVRARSWSPFDLASAVWTQAADDPQPTAETVLFLDQLLATLQPDPQFNETLTLRRLATLARKTQDDKAPWPLSAARLALDLTQRSQEAESRMVPFPWVRHLLDEAAQWRHDAEVHLWEHGFVALAEAEQLLEKADGAYSTILKYENAILDAWHALDDSLILLPSFSAYLEDAPALETAWYDAVREAQDLYDALAPKGASVDDFRLSRTALPARVEDLRQQTQDLRDHLAELQQPFATARVVALIAQSKKPDADAALAVEIEALLATPLLKADDRAALWTAARELARGLNEETLAIDHQESALNATAAEEPTAVAGSERTLGQGPAALRRARRSIELLALAGLDLPRAENGSGTTAMPEEHPITIESLSATMNRLSDPDAPPTVRYQLAQDLQRAWAEVLPARYNQARNLALRDRLSRLAPPFDPWPAVDEIKEHPSFLRRAELARNLWRWLADRATYEGRELDGNALSLEAAGVLRSVSNLAPSVAEPPVELALEPPRLELTPSAPSGTFSVRVTTGQTQERPDVEVLRPASDWLTIRREPSTPGAATFRIDLKPLLRRSGALPPLGVLVRARVEGRSYHTRVPIALPGAVEPWQILISEGPDAPPSTEGELRLRPLKDRQPFTLYTLNPSGKPRKLTLEVKDMGSGVGSGLSFVSQGTSAAEPIGVSPPANAKPEAVPTPEPELPEFLGPLRLRLLDEEDQRKVLATRLVGVSVATPLEYVRVAEVRFVPANHPLPNKLTLKLTATMPLTGPPCPIEMVLPPDRIPGFIAANDGTFLGNLPPDGQELRLFAENIQLRGSITEQGTFYVNIDGVPRALIFRTTFPRQGSPTTPRLDFDPEIRLKAESTAVPGTRYAVQVEVDNASYDSVLEVNLGHFERGAFQADAETVRATRKRRIGFGLLPTGPLVFETAVKDLSIPLRTAGIEGQRVVRARLLRADQTEIKTVILPLVLDESAPRDVRIVGLSAQAKRGSTLLLKAIGTPTESGTKQVVFFLGKPIKDALPLNTPTIPAQPLDEARTTWAAKVPLPENAHGTIDISVQFTNNVDKSKFATETIELTEGEPAPAPGAIRGTVTEGELPQSELNVFLYDAKGVALAQRPTDASGKFAFEKVPPGRYGLAVVKKGSGTRAEATIEVKPGEEATPALKLRR